MIHVLIITGCVASFPVSAQIIKWSTKKLDDLARQGKS